MAGDVVTKEIEMSGANGKNILLVEDEAIIALAEASQLRQFGYTVSVCHDGKTAIQRALSDPTIELVLMDIDLGTGMDGTDTAAEILAHRDVPIVFVSSHSERDIIEQTERISPYGYVTKNSDSTTIEASIRMALRLHTANRLLRESEQTVEQERNKLSLVLDNVPAQVAHVGVDERYLYANRQYAGHFGTTPELIVGRTGLEIVGPMLREEVQDKLDRVFAGETLRFEQRRPGSDGTPRTMLVTYVPDIRSDGTVAGFFSLGVDITNDLSGRVERMNPVAERLTGWAMEDAQLKTFGEIFRIFDSRTGEPAKDPVTNVLNTGSVVALANHTSLVSRNGRSRQIADSAAPIRGPGGNVTGTVLVFRDVTEEYAVKEELRLGQARLRTLFDTIAEGIVIHELVLGNDGTPINHRIIDCNRQYETLIGIPRAHAVGKLATDVYGVPDPPMLEQYASVVRNGKPKRFSIYFKPMKRRFNISCAPWGENGLVAVVSDVGDRETASVDMGRRS